ncbi:MAG TPA: YbaN family protein [Elusimicrobiales bacterium]|nr:YbaN family protein [Elusimicrobiales bacterium]HOL63403.1 YbaN family protein [Elusimicrobiales bacterium]
MKDIKKYFLVFLGSLFVVIGVIGIFLPLLPTTPFLLIASYCYLKSSQKHYDRLINSRYLGKYIKDYVEKKEIPIKVKISSISILWITIIISAASINKYYLKILLLFIAIAVTLHIIKLRSKR